MINTDVAAMRPMCPDDARVACWRLRKLAINETIVIDHGKPL